MLHILSNCVLCSSWSWLGDKGKKGSHQPHILYPWVACNAINTLLCKNYNDQRAQITGSAPLASLKAMTQRHKIKKPISQKLLQHFLCIYPQKVRLKRNQKLNLFLGSWKGGFNDWQRERSQGVALPFLPFTNNKQHFPSLQSLHFTHHLKRPCVFPSNLHVSSKNHWLSRRLGEVIRARLSFYLVDQMVTR